MKSLQCQSLTDSKRNENYKTVLNKNTFKKLLDLQFSNSDLDSQKFNNK